MANKTNDSDINLLKENERLEDLGNGLYIIQNRDKFRFGIDAVLLADFAAPFLKYKSKICEIGTGTGIIPLLLTNKSRFNTLEAFEIQEDIADMAKRSVLFNGLEERIHIHAQDFKEQDIIGLNTLDYIICNPPYTPASQTGESPSRTVVNPNESLAISRHEITMTLEDLLDFSGRTLKQGGKLFLIHRPQRFAEIVSKAKDRRLIPKRARFVHARIDGPATMVLLEFAKDGKEYMNVEKPLIVYDGDGYTDEINKIYGTDHPSREIVKDWEET